MTVDEEASKLKEINKLCLEIIKDDCYNCHSKRLYILNKSLELPRRKWERQEADPCKECPKSYVLEMAGEAGWEKGKGWLK